MVRPFRIVLALVAVLALAAQRADAQSVPLKIEGEGVGPTGLPLPGQEPRAHWVVGTATHLGLHLGAGTVQTDSAEFDPVTGQIIGEFGSGSPFVFSGVGGDKLACHYGRTQFGASYPGTFELTIVGMLENGALVVEALWIAEFVVQPTLSTGRFKGATGSWIMYAWSEPFVLGSNDPVGYAWEGQGWLTLKK